MIAFYNRRHAAGAIFLVQMHRAVILTRAYPSLMYIASHVLLFYLISFKRGARLPVASVAIRMHHFITKASFFLFPIFEVKSTKVTGSPLTCSCTPSTRY